MPHGHKPLIAAAPDLLAACKAIVQSSTADIDDFAEAILQAEAAIRKAEGLLEPVVPQAKESS